MKDVWERVEDLEDVVDDLHEKSELFDITKKRRYNTLNKNPSTQFQLAKRFLKR